MAQGAVAFVPTNGTNGVTLTTENIREIQEYEKIISFRDAILAGTHPRVKVPSHIIGVGKQSSLARNIPSSNTSAMHANAQAAIDSAPSSNNHSPVNYRAAAANGHVAKQSVSTISTKSVKASEINPILLEKSDDLIKAEIQLTRQRLERGLRDQMDQHRLAQKALLQTSESLPDFDLTEVLQKALAIVHPATAPEVEPSIVAGSDSFDENSFYSSQHDTPEPSNSSHSHKPTLNGQVRGEVSIEARTAQTDPATIQVEDNEVVMIGSSLSQDNHLASQRQSQSQYRPLGNLNNYPTEQQSPNDYRGKVTQIPPHLRGVQRRVSAIVDLSQDSTGSDSAGSQQLSDRVAPPKARDIDVQQPLNHRAHNLSPFAPQPARVSPLATARDPPILRDALPVDEAQPPQVAALRNAASGLSSAESSPSGRARRMTNKKRGKKKKRKAIDSGQIDTPDSPYIKVEPRSQSPITAAPLPRPQKRQRQSGQHAELNYDEARYEPVEVVPEAAPKKYEDARASARYEDRYVDRYGEVRRPEPVYQRVERDEAEYQRVDSGGQYTRRQASPVYALPYSRPIRESSHAIVDRQIMEEPRYYAERERPALSRMSVRPDADRERSRSPIMRERRSPIPMGPPRQPVRIIVDAYGREYIDPAPAPPMRQSVAPIARRHDDGELYYERAPVRTMSTRPPVETFEEDGVLYRRASPVLAAPRRIITQPEYAHPEYRSYREREYSVRPTPMGPPGEDYVRVRAQPERRQVSQFEEVPREYMSRPQSVRPEAIRYEVPREYVGRLPSVRPEASLREYAPSVHPEVRREIMAPPRREFSVRPTDIIPRSHQPTAAEGDRYYEVENQGPAIVERPRDREGSVFIYADDIPRKVYR
ncbi:hypothetical protein SBOR_0514 [Sclerotinia borealis F-4128]|uniref:Uncharacterized protein n=1 Tax=Sclerotinia borealis (strain F-4128) TaxID=1432307 RepID=W9CWT1_SCLBF|nr:hypothetical protein SBOR_0514 [Sclerotinia borealis F-4128]